MDQTTQREWIHTVAQANYNMVPHSWQIDVIIAWLVKRQDVVVLGQCSVGKSFAFWLAPFLYESGTVLVLTPLLMIGDEQTTKINRQDRFAQHSVVLRKSSSDEVFANVKRGFYKTGEDRSIHPILFF
jgi:superfamily II DNA helicase RecQ